MNEPATFIKLLTEHHRGRAWVCAMAHGQAALKCEPALWRGMFKRAYQLFVANEAAGHVVDADLAWRTLQLAQAERPARTEGFVAVRTAGAPSAYTHVTTTVVMESYHVKGLTEAMAGTFAWHAGTDDGHRLKLLAPVLQKAHRQDLFSAHPTGTLGVQRMWVSESGLDGEPGDGRVRSHASYQRDYRGLIHLSNTHFLVGYVLDVNRFPTIFRPMILDGAGIRFRSWSDHRPDDDTWGSAVDLHSLANRHDELDGATEAVAPSMPFEMEVLLDVVPLGHPGPWTPWIGQRGLQAGADDDEAFADRIEREAEHRGVPVGALLRSIEEDINAND